MAIIKNYFSSKSGNAPAIDPIAQQRVLMLSKDHSVPSS